VSPSGSACLVLFCLRIVFSFVGGDYCTNTVLCFYHTLIVFMVQFLVLYFILSAKTPLGVGLPVSRQVPTALALWR